MIWEYYTRSTNSPMSGGDLDSYGSKGWELVTILILKSEYSKYQYVFKKLKQ